MDNPIETVSIEPIRELKPHEEIIDVFTIRTDNGFQVGFILNVWESVSKEERIWIGAKVVEEPTSIKNKIEHMVNKSDLGKLDKKIFMDLLEQVIKT